MGRKAALHTVTTQHQLMKWFTGDEINKSNGTAVGFVGVVWRERGRKQRKEGGGAQKTVFFTLIYSVLAEERVVYFSGC